MLAYIFEAWAMKKSIALSVEECISGRAMLVTAGRLPLLESIAVDRTLPFILRCQAAIWCVMLLIALVPFLYTPLIQMPISVDCANT